MRQKDAEKKYALSAFMPSIFPLLSVFSWCGIPYFFAAADLFPHLYISAAWHAWHAHSPNFHDMRPSTNMHACSRAMPQRMPAGMRKGMACCAATNTDACFAASNPRAERVVFLLLVCAGNHIRPLHLGGGKDLYAPHFELGRVPFPDTMKRMVWIDGLDIPAGLEEAFFSVVGFASATLQNTLRLAKREASRFSIAKLSTRSLMIIFQPTWDAFDSTRRAGWDTFWGGWPGSGYSAFIQINAPRYKAGLDLLLDPPTGNLVFNSLFSSAGNGWQSDHVTFSGVQAQFDGNIAALLLSDYGPHPIALVDGVTYRISFFLGGFFGLAEIGLLNGPNTTVLASVVRDVPSGYFEFDWTASSNFAEAAFFVTPVSSFNGYIEQPSVVAL